MSEENELSEHACMVRGRRTGSRFVLLPRGKSSVVIKNPPTPPVSQGVCGKYWLLNTTPLTREGADGPSSCVPPPSTPSQMLCFRSSVWCHTLFTCCTDFGNCLAFILYRAKWIAFVGRLSIHEISCAKLSLEASAYYFKLENFGIATSLADSVEQFTLVSQASHSVYRSTIFIPYLLAPQQNALSLATRSRSSPGNLVWNHDGHLDGGSCFIPLLSCRRAWESWKSRHGNVAIS